MGVVSALLNVMLPVIVVAGVGFVLGRTFELDAPTISKLSLHGMLPPLSLYTLLTTQVSGRVGGLLVGAYLVTTLVACFLGWVATPRLRSGTRRVVMLSASMTNSGNMGLPIALFALGQTGLDQSIIIFLASMVVMFIIAPLVLGSHAGPLSALKELAKLPTIWAIVVAVLLRFGGIELPKGLMSGIKLLADGAVPIFLLALGIQLGSSGVLRLTRAVVTGSLIRIVVMPVVTVFIGYALGLRGVPLQALVLASAMPTAVNAYLFTVEYRADVKTCADTVTLTTALSFATTALVVAALPLVGALG